jgi:hypothetical protein
MRIGAEFCADRLFKRLVVWQTRSRLEHYLYG